jgi:hypothetical protein
MNLNRKSVEVNILDRTLGRDKYRLVDPLGPNTKLYALAKTSSQKEYVLILDLAGYPEACPKIYVRGELKDHWGKPMSETSASMHCYGYEDGNTRLCQGWQASWTPAYHIFALYMRGLFWLECYERHLATGETIDKYLKHA